jgi:nucleoside-diphosphate-sugar epimerase
MILLTGGSGFIGGHFHRVLNHDTIVNLDLNIPPFPHDATFVQGDIRKREDIERAIAGKNVDAIISLAAKHHDFGVGHDEYFDTNEEGTKVICDVAARHQINDIIFFSSVAVYGLQEVISTEETTPRPESPYGKSKLAGEAVLRHWQQENQKRRVIIIRPTVVYGENNVANMYNLIRQIDSGFYFHIGDGKNIKSVAYVENVVQATLYLKNRLNSGVHIYNYADEPQLTSRKISNVIAANLRKKIRVSLPLSVALLLGLPFDLLIKITGKNLPISTSRIRKLNTQTLHSAKKIFTEGFEPKFTTVEGLEKMVAWYSAIRKGR